MPSIIRLLPNQVSPLRVFANCLPARFPGQAVSAQEFPVQMRHSVCSLDNLHQALGFFNGYIGTVTSGSLRQTPLGAQTQAVVDFRDWCAAEGMDVIFQETYRYNPLIGLHLLPIASQALRAKGAPTSPAANWFLQMMEAQVSQPEVPQDFLDLSDFIMAGTLVNGLPELETILADEVNRTKPDAPSGKLSADLAQLQALLKEEAAARDEEAEITTARDNKKKAVMERLQSEHFGGTLRQLGDPESSCRLSGFPSIYGAVGVQTIISPKVLNLYIEMSKNLEKLLNLVFTSGKTPVTLKIPQMIYRYPNPAYFAVLTENDKLRAFLARLGNPERFQYESAENKFTASCPMTEADRHGLLQCYPVNDTENRSNVNNLYLATLQRTGETEIIPVTFDSPPAILSQPVVLAELFRAYLRLRSIYRDIAIKLGNFPVKSEPVAALGRALQDTQMLPFEALAERPRNEAMDLLMRQPDERVIRNSLPVFLSPLKLSAQAKARGAVGDSVIPVLDINTSLVPLRWLVHSVIIEKSIEERALRDSFASRDEGLIALLYKARNLMADGNFGELASFLQGEIVAAADVQGPTATPVAGAPRKETTGTYPEIRKTALILLLRELAEDPLYADVLKNQIASLPRIIEVADSIRTGSVRTVLAPSVELARRNLDFTLADFYGHEIEVEQLQTMFQDVIEAAGNKMAVASAAPERYPRNGAILFGGYGLGKTMLGRCLANHFNLRHFDAADFNGEDPDKRLDLVLEAAEKYSENKKVCVIQLDEVEQFAMSRIRETGAPDVARTAQTLMKIDKFRKRNRFVIILASTNFIEEVDKAMVRAGRLDLQIPINLPTLSGIERIFSEEIRKMEMRKVAAKGFILPAEQIRELAELAKGSCEEQVQDVTDGKLATFIERHKDKFVYANGKLKVFGLMEPKERALLMACFSEKPERSHVDTLFLESFDNGLTPLSLIQAVCAPFLQKKVKNDPAPVTFEDLRASLLLQIQLRPLDRMFHEKLPG